MKAKKVIVNIGIDKIYPHPDNPRKDLGDLSELVESIKKNGVMQNLTVIPGHYLTPEECFALGETYATNPNADTIEKMKSQWSEEGYTLIIGHRRCAAAKLAGINELPCRIVEDMTQKEQLSTMLEENMQRNDLTIFEQAQGFQMMLDLGETEEGIAEKTGFSKTTIRHRLNIAKLDANILKKKEQDKSFQLTLTDLYELEKVEDIKTRNKILNEANTSRDLIWKAQSAVKEAEKKKKTNQIVTLLESMGITEAPESTNRELYSGNWETVREIEFDKEVPKQIKLKKTEDPLYYYIAWNSVKILKKVKKEKKPETPEEARAKQRERNKKSIRAAMAKMDARRKEFVEAIVTGKIKAIKEEPETIEAIWNTLVGLNSYIAPSAYINFFTGKVLYDCTDDEKAEAGKKTESLSTINKMLIMLHNAMNKSGDIYDWRVIYKTEIGSYLMQGYDILKKYGWSFDEEEDEQILNGTHEWYTREE